MQMHMKRAGGGKHRDEPLSLRERLKYALLIRVYTLVYGANGYYKWLAKVIKDVLYKYNAPPQTYPVYFDAVIEMLITLIMKELEKAAPDIAKEIYTDAGKQQHMIHAV